jgi:hypothetical protein
MHVSDFQPSAITWRWGPPHPQRIRVPSCSQIDRNPLTAGYCRQGVQGVRLVEGVVPVKLSMDARRLA